MPPAVPTEFEADRARPSFSPQALGLGLLILCSLLPTAWIAMPAMVDYPNHLARMSILARVGTPAAHPDYVVAWALYPNLAMDLIVPALARLVGVETATRLFLFASQFLIVSGAMVLSHVTQRRVGLAAFVACLFLYATPFAFGFLNFAFALGLGLWGFAAWIRLSAAGLLVRLGVHTAFVAALFVGHLFALGLYGFAIGIWQLWRFSRDWPGLGRAALLVAGMATPVLAIGLLAASAGANVGGSGTHWIAQSKIYWLLLINGYDRSFASGLTVVLVLLAYGAVKLGGLRLVGAGPWLAGAFAALFLAMPFRLLDTGFVDGRVLIALILILPAFLSLEWRSDRARRGITAGFVALILCNLAQVAWVQVQYRDIYGGLIAAIDTLPRGTRLLVASADEADDPPANLFDYPLYHAGTIAVHRRDAFVPTLFTYPGKQPIRPRPALLPITLLEGGPIPLAELQAFARGAGVPAARDYVKTWTRDFDALLLLKPEAADPMPGTLTRLAAGDRFVLYRIVPGSAAASTRP